MNRWIQFISHSFLAYLFLLISLLFAISWYQLESGLLSSIPSYQQVTNIRLNENYGNSKIELGLYELGQLKGNKSAEKKHIILYQGVYQKNEIKQWLIQNIAEKRKVLLSYSQFGELYLRRWELQDGDKIRISDHIFEIIKNKNQPIIFQTTRDEKIIQYYLKHNNGSSPRIKVKEKQSNEVLDTWLDDNDCGLEKGFFSYIKNYFDHYKNNNEYILASLGGGVDCADRIAIPELAPKSLFLTYQQGIVFFAPNEKTDEYKNIVFKRKEDKNWKHFKDIARPLFDFKNKINSNTLGKLNFIVIGKTHYTVMHNKNNKSMILKPIKNKHRFFLFKNKNILVEGRKNDGNICLKEEEKINNKNITAKCSYYSFENKSDVYISNFFPNINYLLIIIFGFISIFLLFFLKNMKKNKMQFTLLKVVKKTLFFFKMPNLKITKKESLIGVIGIRYTLLVSSFLVMLFFFNSETLLAEIPRQKLGLIMIIDWILVCIAIILIPERNFRLYVFWMLFSIILMAGSITLELLAQGANNTYWTKYDLKHMRFLSIIYFSSIIVLSINMNSWKQLIIHSIYSRGINQNNRILKYFPLVLLIPLAIFLLIFILWLLFGKEEGLGVFQPMELGKFFALLLFVLLIVKFDYEKKTPYFFVGYKYFIISLFTILIFYISLFVGIPYLKSDYSPILILFLLISSLFFITGVWLGVQHSIRKYAYSKYSDLPPGKKIYYKNSSQQPPFIIFLILGVLSLIIIFFYISYISYISTPFSDKNYQPNNTHEERFVVYHNIKTENKKNEIKYPNLSFQLVHSLDMIAKSPRIDSSKKPNESYNLKIHNWNCLVPYPNFVFPFFNKALPDCDNKIEQIPWGYNSDEIMSLPAVQDDFIMSFFIYRFGVDYTVILFIIQLLMILLIIDTILKKYIWKGGNYTNDAVQQVLCFLSLGGIGLFILHWSIALSNALGELPVMGQPMTLISSANSHIVFMVTPIVVTLLLMFRLSNPNEFRTMDM